MEENKKEYEKKKELIKIEYQKAFEEKYKKEINNGIKKINEMLKEKLEESSNKLKLEYEKRYEKKEKDLNKKFEEMSEIIMKSNIGKKEDNLKISFCDTIHNGIKCMNCFQKPIIGYRYKCSKCEDYNLCEKCEEENSNKEFHKHDFIKLRKAQKNENNNIINNYVDNNNIIKNYDNDNNFDNNFNNLINNNINHNYNNEINNNNDEFNLIQQEEEGEYSYQCESALLLSVYIFEGTDEAKITLTLSNDGNKPWPRNTKLIFDNNSIIKGDEIKLNEQKPGEKNKYEIKFKNLKDFFSGEYRSFIIFNANGKQYGDVLTTKVVIKEKEKNKNENENKEMEKVKEFRDNFGLSEDDYDDDKLLEILRANNFDQTQTFEALFN